MTIQFRPPTIDDAAMLLEWRSSPRVNAMMYTDVQDGDVEQQKRWIERCGQRDDYAHFIIMGDGEPVGYLSYSQIDRVNSRCSCGSYFGTVEGARKYGGHMHAYFMDYIFHVLGLQKNVVEIIDANQRVVKFQRLLGMREVGVLKKHVLKQGVFRDVHVFELLKDDWEAHRWNVNTVAESMRAFGIGEENGRNTI
jgi:RimJ/RimL family protein N-acetyltransferase